MTKFTEKYFTMQEEEVIDYVKTTLDFFSKDADLTCEEIGDGNLNYVFRVADSKTNRTLIIKQAGPVARISDEFKVSPERNRIESDILKIQYELAPTFVPKLYHYDAVMNCCAMEDLSDHQIMREALLEHQEFPLFADHISSFLVNTLLFTSDVVLSHKNKKELVKKFINIDLCEISEDLVFTEPFYDCSRNDVFELSKDFVREHIWEDEKLALETAKLKFEFMTKTQSLIHGDLHTGSVFIKRDSTKVIDPEFSFYGPAGYDIGNIIANLMFAYMNAHFTIKEDQARKENLNYLQRTIIDVVNLFKDKFHVAWDKNVTEKVATYQGFKEFYLDSIIEDTAAVTGLELTRRIIGLAKVKDITSIPDPKAREKAERILLSASKKFILERGTFKTGVDFFQTIKSFEDKIL